MSLASVFIAALAALVPALVFVAALPRSKRRHGKLWIALGTLAAGALLYAPAALAERWLERWTGIDAGASFGGDISVLLYSFVIVAPLEQGLKVAAVVPVLRSRHFHEPIDGIVYASASALGFVSAHNVLLLATTPPSGVTVLRAALAVPAHLFLAAAWGYALGRDRSKRLGGRRFNAAWIGAMLFNGVSDHLMFARRSAGLVAAAPLVLCMGFIAFLAAKDLVRRGEAPSGGGPRRFSMAAPSLAAVREALRRTERPVMITWIAFGALVTTGVMMAMLTGAVALGHRIGVDFAAVDRVDVTGTATAPLVLLGSAALAAFPLAGYLIARASAARTVLEPAMSAALAIAGSLVLLGLAAPVAVVFAIAFAPIAFGLACAGAWVALER